MWNPSSLFSFRSGLLDGFNPSSVTIMTITSPLDAMIDTTCITKICSKIECNDYGVAGHQLIHSEKLGKAEAEE